MRSHAVPTRGCGDDAPLGQLRRTVRSARSRVSAEIPRRLPGNVLARCFGIRINLTTPFICDREGRDAATRSVISVEVILVDKFAASEGEL
jgi:hypothetical protein